MTYEDIFNQTYQEVKTAGEQIEKLIEVVPEADVSYLPSVSYSLNMGSLWLNELRENIITNNESKEVKEEKEEEDELFPLNMEEDEVEDEVIEDLSQLPLAIPPLEEDLEDVEDQLNKILAEYNQALFLIVSSGTRFHAFLANTVNQHFREANFNLQFEQQRIKDYEGN